MNVQGDEPLIAPDAIDAVIGPLTSSTEEMMSTLRRKILDPADLDQSIDRQTGRGPLGPRAVFLAAADSLHASRTARRRDMWRHLGLYAYRREFLLTLAALPETRLERAEGLEQLRVLAHGFRIATVETATDTIGVDTPEDLERVRQLIGAGGHR